MMTSVGSLFIALLLSWAPLLAQAQTPPDLGLDVDGLCEESMKVYPSRIDLEKLAEARQAQASVQKIEDWYGKDYGFEEALAIVERHLELIAPTLVSSKADALVGQYRDWVKRVFEDGQQVLLREEPVKELAKPSKMKAHGFWNLGFLRKFSFDETFRNSKYVIHWNRKTIQNEVHLFELEQKVIQFLGRAQYDQISGLKVYTRKPKRYLRDNIIRARDQLVLQYYLKGRSGVDPSTAAAFKETVSLMKSWSLSLLWPGNRVTNKLKPIHEWILETYGSEGLSRYLFAKYGPSTALGFAINWFYKGKILITLPLTVIYMERAAELYHYYKDSVTAPFVTAAEKAEARKIESEMTADPYKVLEEARKKTDTPPVADVKPAGPDELTDTLQEKIGAPTLSEKDRDELRQLGNDIEKELKENDVAEEAAKAKDKPKS